MANKAGRETGGQGFHTQKTLEARQSIKVPIGIYEDGFPAPKLRIAILPVPKSGEVEKSVMRLPDKGDYQLICYFQNFSDQEFTVTIDER